MLDVATEKVANSNERPIGHSDRGGVRARSTDITIVPTATHLSDCPNLCGYFWLSQSKPSERLCMAIDLMKIINFIYR